MKTILTFYELRQYFGKTGLSLDDWASVTRASHTPTCERRRTGPPLAARLGRAPPSVAAAAASARDAARTREVQARHSATGTWRGGGDSYVTFALRGAVVHCSGNMERGSRSLSVVTED